VAASEVMNTERGEKSVSVAAAPGGAALVAISDGAGLDVAVSPASHRPFAVRRAYSPEGTKLGPVQATAEPAGGWLVVTSGVLYGGVPVPKPVVLTFGQSTLVALSLDPDGRTVGPPNVLGPGVLGGLAVDPNGRAVLALSEPQLTFPFAPGPVLVTTRPRGGAFGTASPIPGRATDPHVAVGPGGRAVVSVVRAPLCSDNFCAGAPGVDILGPSGATGPVHGPSIDPRRAFAATAALTANGGGVLVFLLKTKPAAFVRRAPVRAVAFAGDGRLGPLQTLTPKLASAPFVTSVGGGRALAVWSGTRGIGAALAGRDGQFAKTTAPGGPPPGGGPSGGTLQAAGRYAIFAWPSRGIVLASVRRF